MRDEAWKRKRGEVISAMTPVKLKAMYPLILHSTKNLVDFISYQVSKDHSTAFDARDISSRYTCDSITICTFGAEAESFTSQNPFFYDKGREMLRGMTDSFQSFFNKKALPVKIEEFFINIAKEAMRCRVESSVQQDDFLSHIIALKDKKDFNDLDAAAFCVTLFIDGFETTSVTLHHALYELGKNKKVQDKLRKEIIDNNGGEDALTYEKLLELPFLDQVFYETLRLHPPLLFTTRVCSADLQVEGFKGHKMVIKKDSTVWIPILSIHRDSGN